MLNNLSQIKELEMMSILHLLNIGALIVFLKINLELF
jgi:hypothetical protein